jgi:hypothetical protein
MLLGLWRLLGWRGRRVNVADCGPALCHSSGGVINDSPLSLSGETFALIQPGHIWTQCEDGEGHDWLLNGPFLGTVAAAPEGRGPTTSLGIGCAPTLADRDPRNRRDTRRVGHHPQPRLGPRNGTTITSASGIARP